MKKLYIVLITLLSLFLQHTLFSQEYFLYSPNSKLTFKLNVGLTIKYAVSVNGNTIISPSVIGCSTDFLQNMSLKVLATKKGIVKNQILYPIVHQKNRTINDNYNWLTISFSDQKSLECRVYNNGVAWRWVIERRGDYKVLDEQVNFQFWATDATWYPVEEEFMSHSERVYQRLTVDNAKGKLASLPALVNCNDAKVLITEADLLDYPGLWLKGGENGLLRGVFPKYPKEKKLINDRDETVVSREEYIAVQKDEHSLPWRVLMIAQNDADLLTNQLVYQLARPALGDYSWVKSGKIAWDWWNFNNIYGVDFRAGVNTATYKYYIDFASKNGLEYIILDEGWTATTTDLLKPSPDINMPELMEYAKQKKVDIILWCLSAALERQMEAALDQFAKWGAKGIKVDFMQRDDQQMVNFYEKTAIEAAKRKLLVDFHGAYKPTGLERTYPNCLTREGVYGLENSKWDSLKNIGPEHNVTIPFIRQAAGPMDYTPGAMLNSNEKDWSPNWSTPKSLGTRCHQLGMYVVFESPLQMLADNPTHYNKEPSCMEFLSKVPTQWDTTIVLHAKVSDYVVVARKTANSEWYIGGMTDWTPREFTLDLSFLPKGNFTMHSWEDGINADRNAQDFKYRKEMVNSSTYVKIKLAGGGGFASRIVFDRP
ncbi:MAG: glycoside hydrolase family 97 protein [Saprospiraceae bacterium]|nr:glycoside hydrolase family 97 protein [Saprospiraceae bacterium]